MKSGRSKPNAAPRGYSLSQSGPLFRPLPVPENRTQRSSAGDGRHMALPCMEEEADCPRLSPGDGKVRSPMNVERDAIEPLRHVRLSCPADSAHQEIEEE